MPAITSLVAKSSSYKNYGSIQHSRMAPGHKKIKYRSVTGPKKDALEADLKDLAERRSGEHPDVEDQVLTAESSNEDGSVHDESDGSNEEEVDDVEDSGSEEEDSEEDEEDEEALMRELQKIREERALAKKEQEEKERLEKVATGNPLLSKEFEVKKSWTQDSVFSNRARKAEKEKEAVSDLLKTDFHKKFMSKYVR